MNDLTTTRDDALRLVCDLWQLTVQSGWSFSHALRNALDTVCFDGHQRADFLTDVSTQTGLSVKRLQNIVSLSRNPSALLAADMGLEISYGETVAGLDENKAEYFLSKVADGQIQTVSSLRREIWMHTSPPQATTSDLAPRPVQPITRERIEVVIYPTDLPEVAACRLYTAVSMYPAFIKAMNAEITTLIDAQPQQ